MSIQNFPEESSLTTGEAQRHRQIERRTFLANIRRRQIDRHRVRRGKIESAISQRRPNSFAAFLHRNIRQANHGKMAFERGRNIHFDFDQIRVNAEHRRAECFEEHAERGPAFPDAQRNPECMV